MVKSLYIAIKPMPYPRLTRFSMWGKKFNAYNSYKSQIQKEMKDKCFETGEALKITFFLPMAKSWSQKKRDANFGMPHQQKPDLDNLVKSVLDALYQFQGGDHKVYRIEALKMWGAVGNPGIAIQNLD